MFACAFCNASMGKLELQYVYYSLDVTLRELPKNAVDSRPLFYILLKYASCGELITACLYSKPACANAEESYSRGVKNVWTEVERLRPACWRVPTLHRPNMESILKVDFSCSKRTPRPPRSTPRSVCVCVRVHLEISVRLMIRDFNNNSTPWALLCPQHTYSVKMLPGPSQDCRGSVRLWYPIYSTVVQFCANYLLELMGYTVVPHHNIWTAPHTHGITERHVGIPCDHDIISTVLRKYVLELMGCTVPHHNIWTATCPTHTWDNRPAFYPRSAGRLGVLVVAAGPRTASPGEKIYV